jgi:uncharacterized protein (DUF1778 family)
MTKTETDSNTARIEARVPTQVYSQLRRAAELRGLTLTGYLIATAGEEARRDVEESEIMRLARQDQVRFADALINPPKPNARLKKAARRHAALVEPR